MAQRLSAEQRRALAILADAGQRGCTDQLMMAHGFTFDLLASLVRGGLATATLRRKRAVRRMIEVARVRITDAGRKALGGLRVQIIRDHANLRFAGHVPEPHLQAAGAGG